MPRLTEPEQQEIVRFIAVKVVDIFGNDTMTIVDVNVGKNGAKKQ